eukprot:TRINITY_DN13162_c0_g2_i1.p1 TRINITY_DN13162_c0_g2~~TRINITY_DN13162_c0_g2_i1.p1  ORF type:complete len:259 (+),score=59.61 TRINITY_DN13162_c0_g2_i1:66-842(+)
MSGRPPPSKDTLLMSMARMKCMLRTSDGHDKIMNMLYFASGASEAVAGQIGATNVADSLGRVSKMLAWYVSISRLQGLWRCIQRQRWWHDSRKQVVFATMKNLALTCENLQFSWEAVLVLAQAGVLHRSPERIEQLGHLCAFCWFWRMVLAEALFAFKLVRLQGRPTNSEHKLRESLRRKMLEVLLWLLLAWTMLPRNGRGVQLLEHPDRWRWLRPLHLLFEKLTVPGLNVDVFTAHVVGMCAMMPGLRSKWHTALVQ